MKKRLTLTQLFRSGRSTPKGSLERKIDDVIHELARSDSSGEEIHELREYICTSLENIEAYRAFLAEHPPANETESEMLEEELEIVISQMSKTRGRDRRTGRQFPNPIRVVISILMITLGFAMIVMPAPPYFEMYTIFYFNESDGFTLMDLISLIIVFCGIFTLIMTMQKHRRE